MGVEEDLDFAELAPGKFIKGYHCVEASSDAKRIELHYDEGYDSNFNPIPPAVFAFDIPAFVEFNDE